MYYVVVKQRPMYHQVTLEEFLSGTIKDTGLITSNISNTRTYMTSDISDKLREFANVDKLIEKLVEFNEETQYLRYVDRKSLYREFYIPKHSGGLRKIDAPNDELKAALRSLGDIFKDNFGALYHTSAFAYIKKRCTIDCLKKHQANESKWYGKTDFSNFFGSVTLEYTMSVLKMLFPFCLVCEREDGEEELRKALELAFLDGGLPQGTPLSPPLTNIIMIPIDHKLSNVLRNYNGQHFVYTRYADDIQISSKQHFDMNEIVKLINATLQEFGAPFRIKPEKTRYGSISGRNFNLGLMINKENNITIGHKTKKRFEAMLHSFIMDTVNGKPWNLSDVQTLNGLIGYYKTVEGEVIDNIIKHVGNKHNVDVSKMIKEQIS